MYNRDGRYNGGGRTEQVARLLMKNVLRDNLVRFPAGGQIIYEECVKGIISRDFLQVARLFMKNV
jgi:hypothetical protein